MDDIPLKPFLRKVKNLLRQETYQTIIATSLSVAILFPITSCSDEYYTQSVRTTIKEIAPHQFVILDETLYETLNQSCASIHYLNGKNEEILFDSLWQRLDESRKVFLQNDSYEDNLAEVVAYSAIGNMLSVDRRKKLYAYYQEPLPEEDYWKRRMVHFYIDEVVYYNSQQVHTSMSHHTVSRSGFFSSHSHGHARG